MTEKFKLPSGVTTWVPGTNLKACLEEAIFMWLNEHKFEVNEFAKQIRRKRDGLHKDNGMSRNGDLKEFLEVPVGLAGKIRQMTKNDWMHDMQICKMVQQLIPDLLPFKGKDESRVYIDKKVII